MNQIDKFKKKFKKYLDKKENKTQPIALVEPVKGLEEVEDNVLSFCSDRINLIRSFTDDDRRVGAYTEETVIKTEKYLIEPFSNTLYNGKENGLGEVISHGGDYFAADGYAHTDFAAGYKIRNLREVVMKNSTDGASKVAELVADNKFISTGNRFYLLSDDIDLFGKNVKSAFRNSRAVWRSVAAAYMLEHDGRDVSVIDFMSGSVTEITVKAEFSKEHKNRYIFTRVGRKLRPELNGLNYLEVAQGFVKYVFDKNGANNPSVIEKLALSNKIYNVICAGATEYFVIGDKIVSAGKDDYSQYIKGYIKKFNIDFTKLSCNLIWADHLKDHVPAHCKYVENNKLNAVLEELDFRLKNGIPLWRETLPALKLDRIASRGRLGNYYLVKENEVIENTFETKLIDCPEKLRLPKGEKEILFPLSVSGVKDKRYVAKVSLEEPFESETNCSVQLNYDFNDENTYSFILRDSGGKTCKMTIEEGEPEKKELPFKLEINANAEETVSQIYNKIKELQQHVAKRKNSYRNYSDKEKPWEFDARAVSNELFSLWITLPYDTKRDKSTFALMSKDIESIIYDCMATAESDELDYMTVMTVRVVLALFIDGYDITAREYQKCVAYNYGFKKFNTSLILASRILCNPSLNDVKIIDKCLKNSTNEIRTLSLPLLANDTLLKLISEHRINILQEKVADLSKNIRGFNNEVTKLKALDDKFPLVMRKIRDLWEFMLGVLRLRGTKFWNDNLAKITDALSDIVELENLLYEKLQDNDSENYYDMCCKKYWMDSKRNLINSDICISRIKFDGIDNSLSLMHPLGYTVITYLEGNPNTHIIGCGLSENE